MYFIFNIRATDLISLIRLRYFILGILMCIYIEKTSNPVLVYCMHCLQSLFYLILYDPVNTFLVILGQVYLG